MKYGLHINPAYARWSRRFSAGIYYGYKSGRLDFRAGTTKPIPLFWNLTRLNVSMYKMEGREDFIAELDNLKRASLIRPPTHQFVAGVNHHSMTDERYIVNPEAYEAARDFKYYFRYQVSPQADIAETRFTAEFRGGRKWFGGDFDHTSFTVETWLRTRLGVLPVDGGLLLN